MRIRVVFSWVVIGLAGIAGLLASVTGLVTLFWGGTPHFFDQFALMYFGFLTMAVVFPVFLFCIFFPRFSALPLWGVFFLSWFITAAEILWISNPSHIPAANVIRSPAMIDLIPAVLFQMGCFLKPSTGQHEVKTSQAAR